MQYDGAFKYNGVNIDFYITDNNRPIRNKKMSRYIHFIHCGQPLGFRAIYGTVEELTSITSEMACEWYEEYIAAKE